MVGRPEQKMQKRWKSQQKRFATKTGGIGPKSTSENSPDRWRDLLPSGLRCAGLSG
jgi:hypothetical protein